MFHRIDSSDKFCSLRDEKRREKKGQNDLFLHHRNGQNAEQKAIKYAFPKTFFALEQHYRIIYLVLSPVIFVVLVLGALITFYRFSFSSACFSPFSSNITELWEMFFHPRDTRLFNLPRIFIKHTELISRASNWTGRERERETDVGKNQWNQKNWEATSCASRFSRSIVSGRKSFPSSSFVVPLLSLHSQLIPKKKTSWPRIRKESVQVKTGMRLHEKLMI